MFNVRLPLPSVLCKYYVTGTIRVTHEDHQDTYREYIHSENMYTLDVRQRVKRNVIWT